MRLPHCSVFASGTQRFRYTFFDCGERRNVLFKTIAAPTDKPRDVDIQMLPGESLFGVLVVYTAAVAAGRGIDAMGLGLPPLMGMLVSGGPFM